MTTLIMVRHGESETNLARRMTGQLDVSLTGLGVRQAGAACEYVTARWHIDRIISSDLKRAVQTARPFAEKTGLDIETEPALREINAGLWQGEEFTEIAQRFPDTYSAWRKDIYTCRPEGGENVDEVAVRVTSAMRRIASENEGSTVLVTTHATPVRVMVCEGTGMPVSRIKEINWVSNASVTVLEYENGVFKAVKCGIKEHLDNMETYLPKSI